MINESKKNLICIFTITEQLDRDQYH